MVGHSIMSPSRSLVALACACAVLPFAACSVNIAGPDNALTATYYGTCNTKLKGYKSRGVIFLPEILIPPYQEEYYLEIPNSCADQNMELVGGVVTACDMDVPPMLKLPPMAAGTGMLTRLGALKTYAHCYVKQFCL